MASNARNLSKLLGTSTQVPTTALPPAIADLETVGQTLSDGEIAPSSIKSNTLTQSFDSNQAVTFNMADSIDTVSPIVSVFKEVPVTGVTSKGKWDVNANATNYDFYDEKPISYSSVTLTPSATGDGTFTNSAAIVTPYMLSNLSYDSKSFDASSQLGNAEGIAFKSDGTAMYLIGFSNDKVWQYTLSTAYDISTASYSNKSFSVASQDGVPRDVRFKPDGTIMYVIASTAPDSVYQYTLSTAWDVSTASYANKSLSVQSQSINPAGLVLSPDGAKVYVAGHSNKIVFQYNLSTAWDVSTGAYSNNSINLSSGIFSSAHPPLNALEVNADGSKLFIGQNNYEIAEYNIPSGDLSNASYVATYDIRDTTVGNQAVGGMTFADSGAKFYIFGPFYPGGAWTVQQFSSTATLAFNAADVGKKVVGNSGSGIITGTSGTYKSVTSFADTSAISSWQLFGAQGKADGSGVQLSGYENTYDLSNLSYDSKSYNASSDLPNAEGIAFKSDGTKMYLSGFNTASDQYTNQQIRQYSLSTAYDISTATYDNTYLNVSGQNTRQRDLRFKPDGTVLYMVGSTPDGVWQYNLSTAWDLSTASYSNKTINVGSQDNNPSALLLSADGTKVYVGGYSSKTLYQYNLSTAWDLSTASYSNNSFATVNDFNNSHDSLELNSSGSKIFIGSGYLIAEYNMPSDGDVSNASYVATYDIRNTTAGNKNVGGMAFANNGAKFYAYGSNDNNVHQFSAGSSVYAYSQYIPALTNSSTGQINSSTWLDINSMTADETKNNGDILYAVSTDNRTSWSVAKASDGVRKIARNNSGTWQYNNDGGSSTTSGFSLSSPSYESEIKLDTGTGGWNSGWPANSVAFNNDGTKMYGIINAQNAGQNPAVYEFSLSTAYDVSTASYTTWINVQPNTGNRGLKSHVSLQFSPNGQYMYVNSASYDHLSVYTLSTAWDISTASHTRNVATTGFSTGYGGFVTSNGIIWHGALGNVQDLTFQTINDYSLSSVGSAQYISGAFGSFNPETLVANADATKIFIHTGNTGSGSEGWVEYTRSSSSAISTSDTLTQTNVWNHGLSYDPKAGQFSVDGTKMIIATDVTGGKGARVFSTTGTILSYGTSETWVNGTNNNEHATLQEALGSQSLNRMDKAQLDAVADNYHFSQDSADTLDLMIAPYAASGSSPISDGVTINYDTEALIREAIPGTDYVAEFPNPTTLNITAVGAANLKIRAQ